MTKRNCIRTIIMSIALCLAWPPEYPLASPPAQEAARASHESGESLASDASPSRTVASRLQARYDETGGFQADFVQKVKSATLGQTLTSHGKVFFKKPGRMRWEFAEPQQLLVANGRALWLYQPSEQQVIKTPFQHAFNSQTPVSFLTGVGRLEEDFFVQTQSENEKIYQLRLTPKKAAEAIGLLDVEVSKKTFDILQAMVTDPLGNTTRVRFTNIDRETDMADELFSFTLPPGVDLVEPLPGP